MCFVICKVFNLWVFNLWVFEFVMNIEWCFLNVKCVYILYKNVLFMIWFFVFSFVIEKRLIYGLFFLSIVLVCYIWFFFF